MIRGRQRKQATVSGDLREEEMDRNRNRVKDRDRVLERYMERLIRVKTYLNIFVKVQALHSGNILNIVCNIVLVTSLTSVTTVAAL